MYADDTQIFSSSYDANELVIKLNSDLANVRDWLIENKLQMHPSKSKLMFIGSSYNLNNKNTEQPVVVNNTPVSRTDTHKCLGVHIDEKLSWDSHIDMICKKASAGIGAMRRIKPFVPVDTLEKVYKSFWYSLTLNIVPLFGTTAENYKKTSYKDFNLGLLGFLQAPIMTFAPLI